MFPARMFPKRMFPGRMFPPVGGGVVSTPADEPGIMVSAPLGKCQVSAPWRSMQASAPKRINQLSEQGQR